MRRFLFIGTVALSLVYSVTAMAAETLVIERPLVAGMSQFRAFWDKPIVLRADAPLEYRDEKVKDRGATADWSKEEGRAYSFDALNRFLLVRFPDAADAIAGRVKGGDRLVKLELVFPWRDDEIIPPGKTDWPSDHEYDFRLNWGVNGAWRTLRPTWHAVAVPLRRPWAPDAETGPTLNAAVNGKVYWSEWGARDTEHDRFAIELEPVEVSYRNPEGRMDLTALLSDERYGASLGERLRTFSDCGLLVRKLETYDHRYYNGVYEWATATGGRAITVKSPTLVATFEDGQMELGALPPRADVTEIPASGKPTAVMPTDEELAQWAVEYGKPGHPDMPDWQKERTAELIKLAGSIGSDPFWYQFVRGHLKNKITGDLKRAQKSETRKLIKAGKMNKGESLPYDRAAELRGIYEMWVDTLIARAPRGWSGFQSARAMTEWNLGREILPGPAEDAIRRYWANWLCPDKESITTVPEMMNPDDTSGRFIHPMADQLANRKGTAQQVSDTYYAKTGDWRGNKSFFRSGFCYVMSTQNFNATASAGALLAGSMIGAERPMADGRNGVENWMGRQWAWGNGSGQEHIDHYYYSVTVKGSKALADYAQTPYDKLMAESILGESMEELSAAWHPGLRRFIAGTSRTSLTYHLGTQDGLHYIMHSMSKNGALTDIEEKKLDEGMKTWGHETPPHIVAMQLRNGSYGPDWMQKIIEEKPLPWEAWHTNSWDPKILAYRHCTMGSHYGLFSKSDGGGRTDAVAYWRHDAETADSMRDISFMDMRYGVNDSNFVSNAPGWIARPGSSSHLQQGNVRMSIMSPMLKRSGIPFEGVSEEEKVSSLQGALAIYDYRDDNKPWTLAVDGVEVTKLPHVVKQGQHITIHDGVSYIGIIPLPATNLGRTAEVVLREGLPQTSKATKLKHTAKLVIENYNLRLDAPVDGKTDEWWYEADKAYCGFVTIMGDEQSHGSFDAWSKTFRAATVAVSFEEKNCMATSTLTYDGHTYALTTQTAPTERNENGGWDKLQGNVEARAVDGADPYPPNVTRSTPSVQFGRERAEIAGAVLTATNTLKPYPPVKEGEIPDHPTVDHRAHVVLRSLNKGKRFIAWNPLPDLCEYKLTLPGGAVLTTDGRMPLSRIDVNLAAKTIIADICFKPGQAEEPEAAKHLLLQGVDGFKVTLNGKIVKPGPAEQGEAWRAVALDR